MTSPVLVISLNQPDDGDGIARFKVEANNGLFSCHTLVWGYADSFAELAETIKGFPISSSSSVNFDLGSKGAGTCNLSFCCVDGLGHSIVWVSVESEYPVHPTSKYQSATICLRIEASAVDSFYSGLVALASGSTQSAELYGNEP